MVFKLMFLGSSRWPVLEEINEASLADFIKNARTYDVLNVEVAVLDGVVDSLEEAFATDCALEYMNPVPLIREGGEVIGSADLYRTGNVLTADIFLRYDSEERLSLEAGLRIYPSLHGVTKGVRFTSTEIKEITHAKILSLKLTSTPNSDHRIKHL